MVSECLCIDIQLLQAIWRILILEVRMFLFVHQMLPFPYIPMQHIS